MVACLITQMLCMRHPTLECLHRLLRCWRVLEYLLHSFFPCFSARCQARSLLLLAGDKTPGRILVHDKIEPARVAILHALARAQLFRVKVYGTLVPIDGLPLRAKEKKRGEDQRRNTRPSKIERMVSVNEHFLSESAVGERASESERERVKG